MTGIVAGHPLPARLAAGDDPGLTAWRDQLPRLVQELLARWELTASAPFTPGGSSAWVAPVRDVDGAERVVKVAWTHEESRDEAAGTVSVRSRTEGDLGAMQLGDLIAKLRGEIEAPAGN